MGDISMIARRLPDGRVQYGWSGNGGYCRTVGAALLCWYNTPEMVEYLFGLGQVSFLARPLDGNYDGDDKLYTKPIGRPHYWTDSEQKIFGKIAFVDYVYFYDTDNQWYYVSPNRFNAKIPLVAVCEYLGRTGDFLETRLLLQIDAKIYTYIAGELYENDAKFRALAEQYRFKHKLVLDSYSKMLAANLSDKDEYEEIENLWWDELYPILENADWIFDYLDRWVIVVPDEEGRVERLIIRKREEPRKETIDWV